jgi:hypothetical protein
MTKKLEILPEEKLWGSVWMMLFHTVFRLVLLFAWWLDLVGDRFHMCCLIVVTLVIRLQSLFRLLFVGR